MTQNSWNVRGDIEKDPSFVYLVVCYLYCVYTLKLSLSAANTIEATEILSAVGLLAIQHL